MSILACISLGLSEEAGNVALSAFKHHQLRLSNTNTPLDVVTGDFKDG